MQVLIAFFLNYDIIIISNLLKRGKFIMAIACSSIFAIIPVAIVLVVCVGAKLTVKLVKSK